MSSSKRNGSVSRAVEAAAKNKLHMDRNPQHSRLTDPSHPAGRRKEIDNVMKRARQGSPGTWDRKLLEVEEKDPNRWRHTGYKQLYIDGSRSPSPRSRRSRSRSPLPMRRSRSPIVMGRRSRSPVGRRSRSPVGRRSRSPVRRKSPPPARRSPRRSPVRRASPILGPKRRSPRPRSPPARRDSPRARPRVRPPSPKRVRPPSPADPRRSSSGSSTGSCSDESCSVCSAKNKKAAAAAAGAKPIPKRRSRSVSPRAVRRPAPPPAAARALPPTKEMLKARDTTKRSREEKVLEWQRTQMAVNRPAAPIAPVNIKREGERRPPEPPPGATLPRRKEKTRGVSPGVVAAALAESDSESESDASSEHPRRLTLSERFGRMAQWSADRSARLENMRITRRESSLHVHIERDERAASLEPSVAEDPLDPAPVGSYPEELLAAAPGGLPSWDDVRVRYDYYKKRGYLRGLTLSDYVKWEEWWYKYQEWLKRERAYERWADGDVPVRRERRKRGGRHRRS